ncbi:Peptidase family M23 [Natronincola peptidivorans]|uniref:Peptidase family M23 n=1 Tax=Natronincola peptidivorans TaxID=426128 RepID=A0A1H9YZZ1_9FIRM|nr:M23 family metallopeptidase [Natronincola peptidivorans]SES74735.1 Peptidase family M23 [Natronincola peptidivorans]
MNERRDLNQMQSGAIYRNRGYINNNPLRNIDYKLWIQRSIYRLCICIALFFIILIIKNINTTTTNYVMDQINYRINQRVTIAESYDIGKSAITNILKRGEKAIATISFVNTEEFHLIMPNTGEIVTYFDEEISNKNKNSRGIILEGVEGEKIVATQEGVVMEVGNNASVGNYIIIKHRGELLTVYKNVENCIVKQNQKVVMGETIGSSSGKLIFEVWKDSKPIDPLLYINIEIEGL